jgi:rhodanese-related sulfurtransferase
MNTVHAKQIDLSLWIMVLFILAVPTLGYTAEEFPLRPYYPDVPFIGTSELLDDYNNAIIVDIRSSFEYEVAHINKAFLLPLTTKDFSEQLRKLRAKDGKAPLAFYCNGHSCAKSYQAAQLAISLGFKNIYVFDGGIFDWMSAAPDKSTLMGETPAQTDRIITIKKFNSHQLDFEEFARDAKKTNTVVIDTRAPFQRDTAPRIAKIRNIPLDPLLDLVTSRIWTEKRLLFFDAVGKQVRWLQYFLESYGYYNYAFLKKGMQSIATDQAKIKPVIGTDRTIISSQEMLLQLTADQRLDNSDRKVISYLLANIKFNNYVVVNMKKAYETIGISTPMLLSSVKKLTKLRYATHTVMQETLIVQVDPRLAWKGDQGGKLWKSTVREFESSIKE